MDEAGRVEDASRGNGSRGTTDGGGTRASADVVRNAMDTCDAYANVQDLSARAPVLHVQRPRMVVGTPRATLQVVAAASPEVEATSDVGSGPLEAVSKLNSVRMSASKVRRVLDQVRGRSYEEALMILEFMPYRSCDEVLKCLYSASANAKNNLDMDKSKLYISHASCDEGPTLKRFRPRAQGRGFPIRKRTCNITIKVAEN